jgi:hypothetical protein
MLTLAYIAGSTMHSTANTCDTTRHGIQCDHRSHIWLSQSNSKLGIGKAAGTGRTREFCQQSGKTGYARPTAKQRRKGVTEHIRIPGHPILAERCDNTDGYLDSTRHAERCVRMSVTQGDASKPGTACGLNDT